MKGIRLVKNASVTMEREYEIDCTKCSRTFEVKAGEAIYHFDRRGHYVQAICSCGKMAIRVVESYAIS